MLYFKWEYGITGYTRSQLATAPNTAFFWSRSSNGVRAADVVREIAKQRGGTALETILEEKRIEMPAWGNGTNKNAVRTWNDTSAAYAEQASGEVRAIIGSSLREGNVWKRTELPILMNNPDVTKIILIDPFTLEEIVIFAREKRCGMFSWDKLNEIIESRLKVPLRIKIIAESEDEKEDILMYNKIIEDMMSVEVSWTEETLTSATERIKQFLRGKYPELSEKSVYFLSGYFSYSWQ